MNLRSLKRDKKVRAVPLTEIMSTKSAGSRPTGTLRRHDTNKRLQMAINLHQKGELGKAEKIYQTILNDIPDHSDALHLLGVIQHQSGKNDIAARLIAQASQQDPDNPMYHTNLGTVFQAQGRLNKAISCFKKAITVNPEYAEAYYNMGNALKDKQQFHEAATWYEKAIANNPNSAEAHYNLACCHNHLNQPEQAIYWLQAAIQIKPNYAEAYNNMGNILQQKGQYDEAFSVYHQALNIRPYFTDVHYNMGRMFQSMGRVGPAVACYKKVLELRPDHLDAYNNLGIIFTNKNMLHEAEFCFNKVISITPNAAAYNNKGNVFREKGQLDLAEAMYLKSLQVEPESAAPSSNLLYLLNYRPNIRPEQVFEAHLKWGKNHIITEETKISIPYAHALKKHLRVGYISPDFRQHSVAYFIEPLLRSHDRSKVEVICYSDVKQPDTVTEKIKDLSDIWRDISSLNDKKAARMIKQDNLDYLIDLAGHTAGNRLPLFAEKLAPIQMTYLGYPNTTGLKSIDYRITDPWADPKGMTEHLHTEKLIHIPTGFLCFQPDAASPPLTPAPVLHTGRITFGSFNQRAKINAEVIDLWSKIVNRVKGSQIIIKTRALSDEATKNELKEAFAALGVGPKQLKLYGHVESAQQHLAIYNQVDICLDTFPYNGTTTTCDSLWMGIPVITLAGRTHVSRVGVSLMSSIGLHELIAETTDEYVSKAVSLAQDTARINQYRVTLREIMGKAPLTNAKKFTEAFEHELFKLQVV